MGQTRILTNVFLQPGTAPQQLPQLQPQKVGRVQNINKKEGLVVMGLLLQTSLAALHQRSRRSAGDRSDQQLIGPPLCRVRRGRVRFSVDEHRQHH